MLFSTKLVLALCNTLPLPLKCLNTFFLFALCIGTSPSGKKNVSLVSNLTSSTFKISDRQVVERCATRLSDRLSRPVFNLLHDFTVICLVRVLQCTIIKIITERSEWAAILKPEFGDWRRIVRRGDWSTVTKSLGTN